MGRSDPHGPSFGCSYHVATIRHFHVHVVECRGRSRRNQADPRRRSSPIAAPRTFTHIASAPLLSPRLPSSLWRACLTLVAAAAGSARQSSNGPDPELRVSRTSWPTKGLTHELARGLADHRAIHPGFLTATGRRTHERGFPSRPPSWGRHLRHRRGEEVMTSGPVRLRNAQPARAAVNRRASLALTLAASLLTVMVAACGSTTPTTPPAPAGAPGTSR